jgi:NAD(P)-dependent dehydrogenase (short-subunit alcohol dehydrogenase family)
MEYPAHSGANFTQTLHNNIYPNIDPNKSDLSQPGKVVLITGSGRGIGRSIALRFAECGVACIILCAGTTSELDEVDLSIKKINSCVKVCKYVIDIANEKEVVAIAEAIRKEGRLDVLVNNAGMSNKWDSITEGDNEMYLKTWDLHMKGTYLILKSFLHFMVETAKNHYCGGCHKYDFRFGPLRHARGVSLQYFQVCSYQALRIRGVRVWRTGC